MPIIASSSFDGSENPLSESGMFSRDIFGNGPLQKLSGFVQAVTLSSFERSVYTGIPPLPDDQYQTFILNWNTGVQWHVYNELRLQPNANSGYRAIIGQAGGSGFVSIRRFDAGVEEVLITFPVAWTAIEQVKFEAIGSILNFYRFGELIVSTTDSVYSSGTAAIRINVDNALDDIIINSWEIGTPKLTLDLLDILDKTIDNERVF